MLEKIYKDFVKVTGHDNTIDKTEFRRLFKKLYIDSQATSLPSALPAFFTTHELNKMADQVFETYDFHGRGMCVLLGIPLRLISLVTIFACHLGKLTFEGKYMFEHA